MGELETSRSEDALRSVMREAIDLQSCVRAFAELVVLVAEVDICFVSLADELHGTLCCTEIVFPPELQHLRSSYINFIYPHDSDNFRVYASRQMMNVLASDRERCSVSAKLAFDHWQASQMVILPLTVEGHPVCAGCVMLMQCGGAISNEQIERTQSLVREAFMLLYLHRRFQVWGERTLSLCKAEAEIESMLKFVAETSNLVRIEEIYPSVLREFLARFDLDIGAIWQARDNGLHCVATYAQGENPVWFDPWRHYCEMIHFTCADAGDGAVSFVYNTGQAMMFGDVPATVGLSVPAKDMVFLSGMSGLQTLLLQPIRRYGRPSGVLMLFSLRRKQAISAQQLEQISHWADFLGAVLESAVTYATLEARSLELSSRNAELASTLSTLRQTQEALVQSKKLSALGSIVVAVAHELNTPIGNALTINTTVEADTQHLSAALHSGLRRSTLESYVSKTQQATDLMSRNLVRAANLISDFKEIAIDRNNVQRQHFDAALVLVEVLEQIQMEWRKSAVKLHVEHIGDTHCDSYRGPLCQVVNNLVVNALQHAFAEGAVGEIRVRLQEIAGEKLCLEVTDNGIGIDPAHLDRIFDPFYLSRLGRGGSGLGLFVVFNIVNAILGGEIRLESCLGKGCRFVVTLPKRAPEGAPGESFSAVAP